MKILQTIFWVLFFSVNVYSQESEIENFKISLNEYIDFSIGKSTVPINAANHAKFRKKVDSSFKAFVLNENSNSYDKLIVDKNDDKNKFLRLDGRVSVNVKTFLINSKTYVVYSYTSRDYRDYYIKENETNKIVYKGSGKSCYVDDLYSIDENHFMVVEKTGDFNSSRNAIVLSNKKLPWFVVKAFEGKAFGQVMGDYFNKKFVKKRERFQLDCEMDFTLSAPKDINKIYFDANTKTISYKQYAAGNKFKLITAKWENNTFVIDDYNVNEQLSGNAGAVPE